VSARLLQFSVLYITKAISRYFINYVTETRSNTSSALGSKFLAGAQASFALGRFVGVGIMYFFRARWVFGVYLTMAIVFIAPAITQRQNTGMSMLYICLFFESICFPTIVALGMKGLGRHTKRGSGFIVAGVMGGACVPPLTGVAADAYGTGKAMFVPLCFFVAAWTYALAVNFWPWYRNTVDAYSDTAVGLRDRPQGIDEEAGTTATEEEKADAIVERIP
jgi:FHS family L-fucose permease-like MFS transporter